MTILCICSSSLNDIIPVNIIYNNLLNTNYKDTLNIDLITTDNLLISNIFLGHIIPSESQLTLPFRYHGVQPHSDLAFITILPLIHPISS